LAGAPIKARIRPPKSAPPYRAATGRDLVSQVYAKRPVQNPLELLDRFEAAYRAQWGEALAEALARHRTQLAGFSDLKETVALQLASAAWLHRMVQRVVSHPRPKPKSAFDPPGLWACISPWSVLLTGLLQELGLDAGIALEVRGRAVTILRLASGHDVLLDAANPTPFSQPGALLIWDSLAQDYRWVEVGYEADGSITSYTRQGDAWLLRPSDITPLSPAFLRSWLPKPRVRAFRLVEARKAG